MFTGIIKYLGVVEKKEGFFFTFKSSPALLKQLHQGVSLAINGVCLTVLKKYQDNFAVEVMPETLNRTMLGSLEKDDYVNLELPATLNTFLSGHITLGHIDGTARLTGIIEKGNSRILKFKIDASLQKYIASKGSIAINGISLTVIESKKSFFTVGVIPYTWDNTMLHQLKTGDPVNIEADIIARYVERMLR